MTAQSCHCPYAHLLSSLVFYILPCRTHPAMKLQRIPTLFQHTKAGKPLALVEDQCKDAELVEELVLAESK